MLHVESMTREDFEFAVNLANTMNWDMAEEDFDFNIKLEPRGCFILFENSERIGIVTTISFGTVGWFGNLIVSENHRSKGAGALLARYAIRYLEAKKVKTVGLYSYVNAAPFYRKLGFKDDSEFIVLRGNGRSSKGISRARQALTSEVDKIVELDSRCLSFPRAKLLKTLLLAPSNFAYVAVENKNIVRYAIAKVYDGTAQIGPVVCAEGQGEMAIDIVRAIIDRLKSSEITICIPERKKIFLDALIQLGFRVDFRVIRMFYGEHLSNGCVFAAESLERG
jgi:GNAT superfamily N-acetyltransferase/type III secretion system FlhB-like substrate exporter